MIRIPGRIPILIHPTFWLFAALIGLFQAGSNLLGILIWVGIIFVSVLFHEMGHALTALTFKRKPRIELVALGGLTYHEGNDLPFWKQFLIVLDGPLFGFLLVIFATILLAIPGLIPAGNLHSLVRLFQIVNLFWTVLNLLPILPLDGGQLLRIALQGFFGIRGIRYTFMVSLVFSLLLSLIAFVLHSILGGALFFLFAYQSYEGWRRSKMMSEPDQKDTVKQDFAEAERALSEGRKQEAIAAFEKIRKETRKGLFYELATQYLAYLSYELGKLKEAYELLYPIKEHLSGDSLCLLHRLAFENKNYPLVLELSSSCFQNLPNAEVAVRNACACAALSQVTPAIGWLKTAQQEGLSNLDDILRESAFDLIRHDPTFQEFVKLLQKQ